MICEPKKTTMLNGDLPPLIYVCDFFKVNIFITIHPHSSLPSTLKEETFAVQENREIFTFRGNKLSRMTSYEKFRGNKLSR